MGAILKGTISGAVIVYIWMIVSWMVIPWHSGMCGEFRSEASVTTTILRNIDKGGVYVMPSMDHIKTDAEEAEEGKSHKQAPKKQIFMLASIYLDGTKAFTPMTYVWGFLTQLVVAFFFTLFTKVSGIGNYFGRLLFVVGLAFAGCVMALVPFWNWWHFTPLFVGMQALDLLIGWFLAGLVIAGVTKRPAQMVGLQ